MGVVNVPNRTQLIPIELNIEPNNKCNRNEMGDSQNAQKYGKMRLEEW